jgi:hypothetical protein
MLIETSIRSETPTSPAAGTGPIKKLTQIQILTALLVVHAVGCGDPTPSGPPAGVDPNASQTPAAIGAPASPKPAKKSNRDDVHRPGPSIKME